MGIRRIVMLAALLTACSGGGGGGSDPVCEPGETQKCICAGGEGAQSCKDDGSGWTPCEGCAPVEDATPGLDSLPGLDTTPTADTADTTTQDTTAQDTPGQDTTAEDTAGEDTVIPTEPYELSQAASWVSSMAFGGVDDAENCCFDLDDNPGIDNEFGKLAGGIAGLLSDTAFNELLQEAFVDGSIVMLMEFSGLDDPVNDDALQVAFFSGEIIDFSYDTALQGQSQALVSPIGLNEAGTWPHFITSKASITGGLLQAGPMQIPFAALSSFLLPLQDVVLDEAYIEAAVTAGPNGKGLAITNGKLGGVISMKSLFAGLNGYIASQCGCLNLDGPLVTYIDDNPANKPTCTKASETYSCGEEKEICVQINSFCSASLMFLKPDIDMDGNGFNDGLSVGTWFDATSVELTGLQDLSDE